MILILAILLAVVLAGCSGLLNTTPWVQSKQDERGRRVLVDTPELRKELTDSYDRAIERERKGMKPSGGIATWNQSWQMIFKANERDGENPDWYKNYIVQKRREAGLPELEGVDRESAP